jgi:hypothetical protein
VDKLYQAANPLGEPSLQAFINKMATLPLFISPGLNGSTAYRWTSRVISSKKLSGKTFPEFLRRGSSNRLAWSTLGFSVPAKAVARSDDLFVRQGESRPRR